MFFGELTVILKTNSNSILKQIKMKSIFLDCPHQNLNQVWTRGAWQSCCTIPIVGKTGKKSLFYLGRNKLLLATHDYNSIERNQSFRSFLIINHNQIQSHSINTPHVLASCLEAEKEISVSFSFIFRMFFCFLS